jgi:hypothetical protein
MFGVGPVMGGTVRQTHRELVQTGRLGVLPREGLGAARLGDLTTADAPDRTPHEPRRHARGTAGPRVARDGHCGTAGGGRPGQSPQAGQAAADRRARGDWRLVRQYEQKLKIVSALGQGTPGPSRHRDGAGSMTP